MNSKTTRRRTRTSIAIAACLMAGGSLVGVASTANAADVEPSIESFSAVAVCADSVYGPRPGVQVDASVVVPDGSAPAAVVISVAQFGTFASDTFETSGTLNATRVVPVGDYVFEVSLDGTVVDSDSVSVSADICADLTPTPTPTPEPTVTPTPSPTTPSVPVATPATPVPSEATFTG